MSDQRSEATDAGSVPAASIHREARIAARDGVRATFARELLPGGVRDEHVDREPSEGGADREYHERVLRHEAGDRLRRRSGLRLERSGVADRREHAFSLLQHDCICDRVVLGAP